MSNDGLKSFDVSRLEIEGWHYTSDPTLASQSEALISAPTDTTPPLIGIKKIENGKPFGHIVYPTKEYDTILLTHYPPSSGLHEASTWIFKRRIGQGALFKARVETIGKRQFVADAWAISDTCPPFPN